MFYSIDTPYPLSSQTLKLLLGSVVCDQKRPAVDTGTMLVTAQVSQLLF